MFGEAKPATSTSGKIEEEFKTSPVLEPKTEEGQLLIKQDEGNSEDWEDMNDSPVGAQRVASLE